ncbi:MAG: TldD/PmbA family protein [bacterium]
MKKYNFSIEQIDISELSELKKKLTNIAEYTDFYVEEVVGLSWYLGLTERVGPFFSSKRGAGLRLNQKNNQIYICKTLAEYKNIYELFETASKKLLSNKIWDTNSQTKNNYFTSQNNSLYCKFDLSYEEANSYFDNLEKFARNEVNLYDLSCHISGSLKKVIILDRKDKVREWVESKLKTKINLIFNIEGELITKTKRGFSKGNNIDFKELILKNGFDLVKEAKKYLKLKIVKPSRLDLVLASGAGGILIHEACGHALEADAIIDNDSIFSKMWGKKVAPDFITITDRGDTRGDWVYEPYDSEGTLSNPVYLIKNGIVDGIMTDIRTAKKLNLKCTGNGRRESYQFQPICRMRNTYVEPGIHLPEEIIKDTKKGIYATEFSGGEVNTQTGDFIFGINSGFFIENGEITEAIKPFLYAGNTLDILSKIDVIGNDLKFEIGDCGKSGQMVDVSYGQPTLRISSQKIGGSR